MKYNAKKTKGTKDEKNRSKIQKKGGKIINDYLQSKIKSKYYFY